MGLFSNKVDKPQIKPGDHVYTYRWLHTYYHHGICVEADRVIHYTRTQAAKKKLGMFRKTKCKNCGHHRDMARGVIKTCVDCFLHGHQLYRFGYGVSYAHFLLKFPGTCTTGRSNSADEVIARATELLNKEDGFGDYKLFSNNCESFAIFCKTGKRLSEQGFAALNSTKILFKAFVKHNVERLLKDVSVHQPDKYMLLKQTFETNVNLPSKEIIAQFTKLNEKYDDEQEDVTDEDLLDDDECLEINDEEGDAGRPSQSYD
ncbi:hypothetical protein D8674_032121 [Pyrus ussuriensis x Pyrus communis]|uniref:LRAT domain-containing protein n=1 Tax=Pyrus ussuriensis x Pyrus communis TaxID=2448454 RepID=A0A5N5F3G0_9ROSA|nr:hypothetical protein D8674_032121 [Pyrus ussuriensis x Pyrus communis]